MDAGQAVLYEVECQLDPEVVAAFDSWLPGHVREVLACPGFLEARIQELRGEPGGPACRRIEYCLSGTAALNEYLEQHAPRLRADGARRFGGRMRCTRRIFRPAGVLRP